MRFSGTRGQSQSRSRDCPGPNTRRTRRSPAVSDAPGKVPDIRHRKEARARPDDLRRKKTRMEAQPLVRIPNRRQPATRRPARVWLDRPPPDRVEIGERSPRVDQPARHSAFRQLGDRTAATPDRSRCCPSTRPHQPNQRTGRQRYQHPPRRSSQLRGQPGAAFEPPFRSDPGRSHPGSGCHPYTCNTPIGAPPPELAQASR